MAFLMPKHLCNQVLPKTLRFSLQRHKSCKKLRFLRYSAKQNSWIVCRFPLLHLETHVLATALCKSSRIRRSRILGTVCRFPLLRLETPVLATALCKSSRIRRSRILGTVCRFSLLRLVAPVLPTAFVPVRYGLLQTG